jgi:hypothetical protein
MDPVDPATLADGLPPAPGDWRRSDAGGGIVEYRLPEDDGVCAAGKLIVRPAVLGDGAARVDRVEGCQGVGTTRHDDVASAADAVRAELDAQTR